MRKDVVLSVYCKHKQGGFTKRLYRAYQAIADSGHELIYVASSELPVSGKGINAVILNMRSTEQSMLYWPEFYWRATFALRRLSKMHQVKTHFVFSFFYATTSILSGIGLPVKTITLIRGDDVFDSRYKSHAWLRGTIHQLLEKIGVHFSAKVLATNSSMQKDIQARNPKARNIGVLPNDITTSALDITTPTGNQPVKIVTVSVLNERKNIHLVLQALARIKHLDWEYLLIGPDTSGKEYGETLKRFAEQHGIADRVKFLGWQSNAAQTLQNCQLFVFPTLMEGSPNALMEAMGYGLPCLASRIPEVTEVLQDPQLHFDPKAPEELVQKLTKFITDEEFAQQVRTKTASGKQQYQFDWNTRIVELISQQSHSVPAT
ncbi:MAG: glycosyltransferase family 4 protein [Thiolinea sp.]